MTLAKAPRTQGTFDSTRNVWTTLDGRYEIRRYVGDGWVVSRITAGMRAQVFKDSSYLACRNKIAALINGGH